VSGLTQAADASGADPATALTRLTLTRGGESWTCDARTPTLSIGRVAGNDVVVPTDLTSRHHAEIAFRRGRFYVSDNSANGTVLVGEDGSSTSLRRERHRLPAAGRLCVGGNPDGNPQAVLGFRCE
jgi:adenylate cyclase